MREFINKSNDRKRECLGQNPELDWWHDLTFLRRTPHAAR